MKRLITILLVVLMLCVCLTSCAVNNSNYREYEVILVTTYPIVTGKDATGPIEKTRVVFVYTDNGTPKMIKGYYEADIPRYADYIVVGDTNKYVVVMGYRDTTRYLYLTQETYDELFPEGHPNE